MISFKHYAMTVDTRRCVGCGACVISCKTENALPPDENRARVINNISGRFPKLSREIRSERCNHCESPPCVPVCPTGASHVNKGGAILVTREKCIACAACIDACPYDARYMHPEGFADKCSFCLHRLQKGHLPACVETCPTKALAIGDLNDSDSAVSVLLRHREHKTLKPEAGTKPSVFFLL